MRLLPLAACLFLTACTTGYPVPSLAPRPSEAIDPRVPVPEPVLSSVPDAALVGRLATLEAEAGASHDLFVAAAGPARSAANAAGSAGSESWIAAQQALSALVAARTGVTRALAQVDELGAARVRQFGGIAAADLRAIQATSARISAIDRSEAAVIDELQARLGG
ncbi:hypothetical protein G7078_04390 [Sphingomonas sinipercae]|uniref:Lipoprotein n=1 Tax=Sphingomonas sinipercae TaxID=2714944 RepID=A0A6G7ZMF8_9SPHN|nr:hypothetical protein [Sphingomonas sinipercae]QIL02100.1 hypothetical protein G7078_04390 [Sphingomonas sinipercae]